MDVVVLSRQTRGGPGELDFVQADTLVCFESLRDFQRTFFLMYRIFREILNGAAAEPSDFKRSDLSDRPLGAWYGGICWKEVCLGVLCTFLLLGSHLQ